MSKFSRRPAQSSSKAGRRPLKSASLRLEILEERELLDAAPGFESAPSSIDYIDSLPEDAIYPIELSNDTLESFGSQNWIVSSCSDDYSECVDNETINTNNQINVPIFDFIEERTLSNAVQTETKSTIVTTANDLIDSSDGLISLREAIQYANQGDKITFDTTLSGSTITLNSSNGGLEITKGIKIDASALEAGITISGGDDFVIDNILSVKASNVALKGLTIQGGDVGIFVDSLLFTTPSKITEIDNCVVSNNKKGILVYSGSVNIVNSVLENSDDGVRISFNGSVDLADCIISNNNNGINVQSGSVKTVDCALVKNETGVVVFTNCVSEIYNATITDNDYGVMIFGACSLYNSIVALNKTDVPNISGSDYTLEAHNTLSSYTNWTAGSDNLIFDSSKPLFVGNGDYRLAIESQALDKGNNSYALSQTDLKGDDRVDGEAIDLGACESSFGTSTIVVTSELDAVDPADGLISFREALQYAVDGDTITFSTELKGKTIKIDSALGEFIVDKSITIDASQLRDEASSTPAITLDGQGISSIMKVESEIEIRVDGVVFTNGYSDSTGGGVFVYGQAALTNCTISNNYAVFGGGVYVDGQATLTNCTISNNSTSYGGGVYVSGRATLTNCTISNNSASNGGGGVYVYGRATLTNCSISNNSASNGGGVYVSGRATLTNCTISNNSANNRGGGVRGSGQAILTITNCSISNNSASYGGGVYVYGRAILTNCTISNNSANYDGGGVYVYDEVYTRASFFNSIIQTNTARRVANEVYDANNHSQAYNTLSSFTDWAEGADNLIYAPSLPLFTDPENGDYTLAPDSQAVNKGNNEYVKTNADLTGFARCIEETVDLGAYEFQGIIATLATPTNPRSTITSSSEATLTWDSVVNASGYELLYKKANDDEYTVIRLESRETLYEISKLDSTVDYYWKVRAVSNGKTFIDSQYTETHSIFPEAPSTMVSTELDVVDPTDGLISLREALQLANDGNTITFSPELKGKAIKIDLTLGEFIVDKSLTIDASQLRDDASSTLAITLDGQGISSIMKVESEIEIRVDGVVFTNGYSDSTGGGVYVYGQAALTNCTISNNYAVFGGGVYVDGRATLTNCTISNNYAYYGGGGVYVDGQATLTNCTISNNSAKYDGGGVYVDGQATLTNCTISNNSANYGGGVFVNGRAILTNCTISNNSANYGGGVCVNDHVYTRASFFNSIIQTNTARDVANEVYDANNHSQAYNTLSSFTDWAEGADNLIYDPSLPLFTDPENGDYTLAPGSQAVNKGNNEYVKTNADLTGFARCIGETVDLGAYEFQGIIATLATPTNLRSAISSSSEATLTWDSVVNASGYELLYKKATDNEYTVIRLDSKATLYEISKLDSTVDYYWKVRAVSNGKTFIDSQYAETHSVFPETPSTMVSTELDVVDQTDGLISLREALQYAVDDDTITFSPALKGKTIKIDSALGEFIVDKSIMIDASQLRDDASSTPAITLDGQGVSRIMKVESEIEITIDGVVFTNGGSHESGGGIYVYGQATLTNCTISNNYAYYGGGGVYIDGQATLTNCTISNNSAYSYYGGGVYVYGRATLTNCTISNNYAYYYGGGVYVCGQATLTNCTISNNYAYYYGGGVYVGYGSTRASFFNSIIQTNTASVDGNEVYDADNRSQAYNTLSSYTNWSEGADNFVFDADAPLFTAPENGDYTLALGSQAFNKGNNDYVTTDFDLAGGARIVGGIVDLGAYESPYDYNIDISQSIFYSGDVAIKATLGEDIAGAKISWLYGASSQSITTLTSQNAEFVWDTTKYPNSSGALHIELLYNDDKVVRLPDRLGTILNAPNVVVKRGEITEDETWQANKLYVVVGKTTLAEGVNLTIQPNTKVKFVSGAYLNVESGAGVSVGSGAILTRFEDDEVGGDTNLDGDLSRPKYGASYFRGDLTKTTIDAGATIKYVTTTLSGTLAQNETWFGGQVYRVTGDLTVPNGVTLTILPGAIVKFDSGKSLVVAKGGKLVAKGTGMAPIVFTSILDDEYGGDSNGDGDASVPQAGDWAQILVGGTAEFDHSVIRYSGSKTDNSSDGAVFASGGGTVVFKNGEISDSKLVAAHADNSSKLDVSNTLITNAMYGTHNGSYTNCTFNELTYLCNTNYYYYSGSFVNCVVANVSKKYFSSGTPSYTFQNNLFYNPYGSGPQTFAQVGKNGNIWANPLFRNAERGDFRLAAGSPCIDAANGSKAPLLDADGAGRYTDWNSDLAGTPNDDGAYVDIGTYEFTEIAESAVDLEPIRIVAPSSVSAGESVTIQYTTRNNGANPTSGAWSDEICLVSSTGSEQVVATHRNAAVIEPGDVSTQYATFKLPSTLKDGNYTFLVRVNPNREIYEGVDSENNALPADVTTSVAAQVLNLPANNITVSTDLTYYKISVPAGSDYYLTYSSRSDVDKIYDLRNTSGHIMWGITPSNYFRYGDVSSELTRTVERSSANRATIYLGEGYLPTTARNDGVSSSSSVRTDLSKEGYCYEKTSYLYIPKSSQVRDVYIGVATNNFSESGKLSLLKGTSEKVLDVSYPTSTWSSIVNGEKYARSNVYFPTWSSIVTLKITGAGFYQGMPVYLQGTSWNFSDAIRSLPGKYVPKVDVVSPTEAMITLDGNDMLNLGFVTFPRVLYPGVTVTPSLWPEYLSSFNLVVDGKTLALTASTVASIERDAWNSVFSYPTVSVSIPDSVRAGRVYEGTLAYSSDRDRTAPIFILTANEGTLLSLDGDFTNATNTLQIMGLGSAENGARLLSSDSGNVKFYFKSSGAASVTASFLYYSNNEECADKTYFETWKEYHESLVAASARLNARGKTNYSAEDAFLLAVLEKEGEAVSAISGWLSDSRDHDAIANATILAEWLDENGVSWSRAATTDENGWFSLEYLPANTTYTLYSVDAVNLSRKTIALGDSDLNNLKLTGEAADRTKQRAVAVENGVVAQVVYKKSELTNNRAAQATLIVTNETDAPIDSKLLYLSAFNGAYESNGIITLDSSKAGKGYYASVMPDGFNSALQILTFGADGKTLQPGESIEIPIYWGGWVKPWNDANFEFVVSFGSALNGEEFEISELEASMRASVEASSGYGALTDAQWSILWSRMAPTVGETIGDYAAGLTALAQELAEAGTVVRDVDAITQALVASALDAFTLTAEPTSSTDNSVGSANFELSFSRVYQGGTFLNRFADSTMGLGWKHSWDYRFDVDEDGNITIASPSGFARVFQVDRAIGQTIRYRTTSDADEGALLRNADGTYTLTELSGDVLTFSDSGLLTQFVDANGNALSLTYDAAERLTKVEDDYGRSLTLTYNASDKIASVLDSDGKETTYEYDPTGAFLTKATWSDGRTIEYEYDVNEGATVDAMTAVQYADGTRDEYLYDDLGRLVGVQNSAGTSSRVEWISTLAYKIYDGDDYLGTFYLNERGATMKTIDALGRETRYEYDAEGRLASTVDSQGNVSNFYYDAKSNLTLSTDATGAALQYEYDAKSFVTMMIDGNGNACEFSYDDAGRLVLWTRADGSSSSATYNANGTTATQTDRAGATVSFEYDDAGNPISVAYSTETTPAQYVYDERGNLTQATDASGTTTMTYDVNDRMTKVVYPNGRTLEYAYDALGRQISVTDGGAYYVGYTYDAYGRLAQVRDKDGNATATYAYDAKSRLERETAANGTYTLYAYDALSRLTSKTTYTAKNAVVASFAYTYDALDNIASMTTVDGVWTYEYDVLGQITKSVFASTSSAANHSYEFRYDAVGNRAWSLVDGVETNYAYDNMNRLLADGTYEYAYDAYGALTSKTNASTGEALTYQWNQRGQMVACLSTSGEKWSYEYDVFGNRVATVHTASNGDVERTEYLVDPNTSYGDVVASYDANGALQTAYVYGHALVAQVDGAGQAAYYASDSLGSTAALTDAAGKVVQRYAYDQHGNVLASSGNLETPFQFVGTYGVMTGESAELISMRARWYDPAIGRFVSEDPIGYDGGDVNLYRYCGNAVTKYVDVNGHGRFVRLVNEQPTLLFNGYYPHWAYITNEDKATVFEYDSMPGEQTIRNKENFGYDIYKEHSNFEKGKYEPMPNIHLLRGEFDDDLMTQAAKNISHEWNGNDYSEISKQCLLYASHLRFEYWLLKRKDDINKTFDNVRDKIYEHLPDDFPYKDLFKDNANEPRSTDPNEIVGPIGVDFTIENVNEGEEGADPYYVITTPNWTDGEAATARDYTIYFENKATATAAAQEVFVTATLPAELDWSTFELGAVGIGGQVFDAPVGYVDGTWTVAQKSTGDSIQISVDYDPTSGEARWYLRSYVDSTGDHFPVDAYAGFLPPNDETGAGEGYVSFRICYAEGLATATKVEAGATIVFDANEAIDTNIWHTTIDATAPTAAITETTYDPATRSIAVSWSGEDAESGVAAFDVYYSVDGGETYALWFERTTETSGAFAIPAVVDSEYAFQVVAYDAVGNSSTGASATIQVEAENLVRLTAGEFVVERGTAAILSAETSLEEGARFYWAIVGDNYALADDYLELGEAFTLPTENMPEGNYVVALKVQDASGIFSAATTATLVVKPSAPRVQATTLSLGDGSTIRLQLNADYVGGRAVSEWRVNWGDGTTETIERLGNALTLAHRYAANVDACPITLELIDAAGNGAGEVYEIASYSARGVAASASRLAPPGGLGLKVADYAVEIASPAYESALPLEAFSEIADGDLEVACLDAFGLPEVEGGEEAEALDVCLAFLDLDAGFETEF